MPLLNRLNSLKDVPFEKWPSHGIKLKAVSANADGRVNSGLTGNFYFYRVWSCNFTKSQFQVELA